MAAQFKPSAACCNTPAIIGEPYNYTGSFIEVDETTVYTAGPEGATQALLILYDIFGFSHQILRGVDKLAERYKIFMPGFFGEHPAPMDWMPFDGPAQEEKMDEFTEGPGETYKTLARMEKLRQSFQKLHPAIGTWGLVGYCWGGWVANFALGPDTPYKACAELHPGFPSKEASQISVPILALCSQDEPEEMWKNFKLALTVENRFEMFPEMVHGWMSARADLTKEGVRKDFDRGYEMLQEWFLGHL